MNKQTNNSHQIAVNATFSAKSRIVADRDCWRSACATLGHAIWQHITAKEWAENENYNFFIAA